LLLSLPTTQHGLDGLLRPPTPTATDPLPLGAGTVLVTDVVPWGNLRVDGKRITPPAARPGPLLPLPIAFGRGRHRLEYQADPFPTLRCLFSVPAAAGSDTCPMVRDGGIDPSLGDARLLDLGATPEALPTDQRRLLTQVVAAALTTTPGTATVAAGDHYLGPTGTAAVARDPVQASLRFAL